VRKRGTVKRGMISHYVIDRSGADLNAAHAWAAQAGQQALQVTGV
jgi:hypothetical protein